MASFRLGRKAGTIPMALAALSVGWGMMEA
ncbi:hypothetical protein SAMN04489738_4790 [Pseudarthrobacter chlorophenolicus]|nr:hypothetical protein SAMN04489738_4790 [Pseudarthrobacter chlorophenolicus]